MIWFVIVASIGMLFYGAWSSVQDAKYEDSRREFEEKYPDWRMW